MHALRELDEMSIPPYPEYYKVWYAHLERKNNNLSSDIESKINSKKPIDEIFLKNIHGKYFTSSDSTAQIEDYAGQLLQQSNTLQDLITTFDSSAKEFHSDLDDASTQMRAPSAEDVNPRIFLESLLQAAQKTFERNAELENNLSKASNKIASLQEAVEMIATDANTDFLTKLSNRRYFDNAFIQLIETSRISDDPLCLIVADIDHFKKFNDTWGHQTGDQVLKLVAGTLRENVKGQDLIARYGGEEFCIAVPNTSLKDSVTLADNIRIAISKRKLINKATNVELGRITMSFGVAEYVSPLSLEDLFKKADAALYEAKNTGRNRVMAATG